VADADLPTVSSPGVERDERALPGSARPAADGEPAGARGGRRGRLAALGLPVAALLGLVAALGVASLVGDEVRSALLVEVETEPVAELSYRDAPEEAARFFAERDTVTVAVPRDMSVADFLALYHLETNPAAREALRDQLGAVSDADPLREGDQLTLPLTPSRPRSR